MQFAFGLSKYVPTSKSDFGELKLNRNPLIAVQIKVGALIQFDVACSRGVNVNEAVRTGLRCVDYLYTSSELIYTVNLNERRPEQ